MKNKILLLLLLCSFWVLPAQTLLKDINEVPQISYLSGHKMLTKDKLLFSLEHPDFGYEPWITDGTEAGTYMIKDVLQGTKGSFPMFTHYSEATEKVYFILQNATKNTSYWTELWVTDFTEGGTQYLATLPEGIGGTSGDEWVEMNEIVYFVDGKGVFWRTDGTEIGTYVVRDLAENITNNVGMSAKMLIFEGKIYCHLQYYANGLFYYWQSDGTSAGTNPLTWQGNPVYYGSTNTMNVWNNQLYFFGIDSSKTHLFRTDGGGTELQSVAILPFPSQKIYLVGSTDNNMYFHNIVNDYPNAFFKTDGTSNLIIKFDSTKRDSTYITGAGKVVNQHFLFEKNTTLYGTELWTDADTSAVLFQDIWAGQGSAFGKYPFSSFSPVWGANDLAYFLADDSLHGQELWRTDGTKQGTFMLQDYSPNSGYRKDIKYMSITAYQNETYFVENGKDLYVTDGTNAGTKLLASYDNIGTSSQIWGSNEKGIIFAATKDKAFGIYCVGKNHIPVKLFSLPSYSNQSAYPHAYTRLNDKTTVFIARDEIHQTAVWKTDGTSAGTQYVANIPVPSSSLLTFRTLQGKMCYVYGKYQGPDTFSTTLWVSDGSPEGTKAIWEAPYRTQGDYQGYASETHYFWKVYDTTGCLLYSYDGNKVTKVGAVPYFFRAAPYQGKFYFLGLKNQHYELWESDGNQAIKKITFPDSLKAFQFLPPYLMILGENGQHYHYLNVETEQITAISVQGNEKIYVFYLLNDKILATNYTSMFSLNAATNTFEKTFALPFRSEIVDIRFGQNVAFMIVRDSLGKVNLYRTDGTNEGSYFLKQIDDNGNWTPSSNYILKVINNIAYMGGWRKETGFEWWQSDGTETGTFMIKDICESTNNGYAGFPEIEQVGASLVFTAADRYTGFELWKMPIVTQVPDKQSFLIFPNPANETCYLQFENETENKEITIFNALGQKMFAANIAEKYCEVPTAAFPTGIYYVVVKMQGKTSSQNLLIGR